MESSRISAVEVESAVVCCRSAGLSVEDSLNVSEIESASVVVFVGRKFGWGEKEIGVTCDDMRLLQIENGGGVPVVAVGPTKSVDPGSQNVVVRVPSCHC